MRSMKSRKYKSTINAALLCLLLLAVCASCLAFSFTMINASAKRRSQQARNDSKGVHRHGKLDASGMSEIIRQVKIVEVTVPGNLSRENIVNNLNHTRTAFTLSVPDSNQADASYFDRIYFEERRTGKVYEIQNIPLPFRPLENLAWANNNTLVFDRPSSPQYGTHYSVNAQQKRMTLAASFD